MEIITIDCALFTSPGNLHRVLAESLCFPDHYGCNLDALHGCLTDVARETRLRFLHWDMAESLLPRHTKRAILDAARENPLLCVIFD